MKTVFWLLLAALLIWGWQNPEKVRNTGDTVSKWVGEKSRFIADKWAPLPPPPPPPPAGPAAPAVPPLPELPEGVFLLREEVIVATGNGTVKWPLGTSIRKMGEGAGKVLVSDGTNQTTVDVAMLTRDSDERRAIYKRMEALNASQTKMASQALESELVQVEAKLTSLQAEKRQLALIRAQQGQAPFGTSEEFLDLAIKRQEDRRNEIYKALGRAPRMVIAR